MNRRPVGGVAARAEPTTFSPEGRGGTRFVVHCPPGEIVNDFAPGDLILIRGNGPLGAVIRAAARIRHRDDPRYAYWSHAALVLSPVGHLIEVHALGVGLCGIEKYRRREFHYVRLDLSDQARLAAVRHAYSCMGQRYGVSGFLLLGLFVALGDRLRVPDRGQQGCVALIARALQRAGITFDRAPPDLMPADLARRFGVLP